MINVIIADDHNLVREGIRALLEKAEDITVVGEAENGEQALELVQAIRPDVLVMDIAMPGMNGKQTFDALKAIHQKLRVILCTGYADQRVINQLTRNEGVIYLPKPFTIELLDRKLRELTAKP